jgi:23S rRNA pseudouridine2605 synthase
MRVQKLLAQQGIASRRKAEELIAQGRVFVNGKRAALGTCACPQKDTISVLGHGLVRPQSQAPQELVLVMNKPKGYLCSHSDPHHSQTIYDLVPSCYQKERLLCAGRLDKESEGLLILSNSGSIIQRLCHPRYGVTKRYSVTLHKPFDPKDVVRFIKGIQDEGEHLAAQAVLTAPFGHDACRIEVHLAQGRKREIRRLCQAFGYYVTQLRRFQIGKFVLKKIPLGAVRKLSVKEVSMLLAPGSAG